MIARPPPGLPRTTVTAASRTAATLGEMAESICMLASEATPFAKTGGLADVAGALTKQLHLSGHDVRLVLPVSAQIDRAAHGIAPVEGFADLPLEFGPHRWRWSLHSAPLPRSGARAWFIDVPGLFARSTLYTDDPDEHLRFIAFTRAEAVALMPDIARGLDFGAVKWRRPRRGSQTPQSKTQ